MKQAKDYLRKNNPSKDNDKDGIPNAFDVPNIKGKKLIIRR